MANCCGGASSVIITGGDSLRVTGSGSVSDPYVISGDLDVVFRVLETETITMALSGSGTDADPYVLSGAAKVSVNDLTDVQDPTPAVIGDVLQYDGSNWVYGPAPTQAPGQVNTGSGIEGDGTVGDPIGLLVSNATDVSTDGLYTYIDSNGELRAQAVTALSWAQITNKPTTFTPSAHSHANADLTGLLSGTAAPTSALGVNGAWYVQYV